MEEADTTYFKLLDRDTHTLSSLWKGLHITSLVIVAVSGFVSSNVFDKALHYFGDHCVLFAIISFVDVNSTVPLTNYGAIRVVPPYSKAIDVGASTWGSKALCDFCQFTPLACMICAIIWCTFFVMCSKGGTGYISDSMYNSWRLIYPALIFTIIAIILMLVNTLKLSSGIKAFCAQFESIFNTTKCTRELDDYTLGFSDPPVKNFTVRLRLTIIFSYICLSAWLALLISLIVRIVYVADFQLIRIIVANPEKQEIVRPESGDFDKTLFEKPTSPYSDELATPPESKRNKMGRAKQFILGRKSASELNQDHEPHTESSNVTLSPDLSQRGEILPADETMPGHKKKESADQHRVSFASSPQEDTRVVSFADEDLDSENEKEAISMSLLNGKTSNSEKTNGNIVQTTLYRPPSVFDM